MGLEVDGFKGLGAEGMKKLRSTIVCAESASYFSLGPKAPGKTRAAPEKELGRSQSQGRR